MTKKEAVENHRKLWTWIAEKTIERKRIVCKSEYFDEMGLKYIESNCYCCEYAKQFGDGCCNCPVVWVNENEGADHGFFCVDHNTHYEEWEECEDDDYLFASELAYKIANLPEKGGDL